MLQMLAVFAEFETAIRSERLLDGIAKAKAIGTKFGRKVKATPERIFTMRADGETGPEAMRDQRSPKVMIPKQFIWAWVNVSANRRLRRIIVKACLGEGDLQGWRIGSVQKSMLEPLKPLYRLRFSSSIRYLMQHPHIGAKLKCLDSAK